MTKRLDRKRPALRAIGLAAATMLALTGCMKLDMHLDLQPDDTIDGTMTTAVSKELIELSGEDGDELVEQMQQDILGTGTEGLDDASVEPFEDEHFIGTTMRFQGAPLEQFGAGSDEDSLSVVREGDELVVSGAMDLSDDGVEDVDMSLFGGVMEVRIAVTFPGDVAEHNGTLDGRTVTWTPQIGERVEMAARGSAVAGSGTVGDGSQDATSGEPGATGDGETTDGETTGDGATTEETDDATGEDSVTSGGDTDEPAAASGAADDDGGPLWLGIGIGALAMLVIALVVAVIVVLRKQRAAPAHVPAAQQGYGPPAA